MDVTNGSQTQLPLDQLRQIRIEKAKKMRALGIDPYPAKAQRTKFTYEISENFEKLENTEVTVAGRLMSWREHGALAFSDLQDAEGQIQLYIKSDELEDTNSEKGILGFKDLNLVDIGDIAQAKGIVVKTQRGELSILVKEFKILSKSIRPLPDKRKGITDPELIQRKKYLDLILNPDKKYRYQKRAEISMAIRKFLYDKGFLEIKTPILQPLYGGGLAKPFKSRVNALDVDFYLAIAHELYLKRLITAGFEKVFNITGYFRNEGIDSTHNPEFEMLETMSAYENYEYNMDLLEELYKYIADNVFQKSIFKIHGHEIDFSKKWERIKMIDAVKKYGGHDFEKIKTLEEAHKLLAKLDVEDRPNSIGESMVKVFEAVVEEKLIQPTIVFGHPVEISPLAKAMPDDKRFVERFEVFMGGIETGDNWSELNDPVELFERFKSQTDKRKHGDLEAHQMDLDFIEMMEYGMPPTTGLGPGIDRMTMMFTDTENIDDVLFFPMVRPKPYTDEQKIIYGLKDEVVENNATETPKAKDEKKYISDVVLKTKTPSNAASNTMTKQQALDLLHEHMQNQNLRRHCYAVGFALAGIYDYLAGRNMLSEDSPSDREAWEVLGIIHDSDYELTKDDWTKHTLLTLDWLKEMGISENDHLYKAMQSHNNKITKLREPQTQMEWALECVDELTGFIVACALVMPEKKLESVALESVQKKWKQPAFAKGVIREQSEQVEEKLGIPLPEFMGIVLKVMQEKHEELGL